MTNTFEPYRKEYQRAEDKALDAIEEVRFELDIVKHMLFIALQHLGVDYYEEHLPDDVPAGVSEKEAVKCDMAFDEKEDLENDFVYYSYDSRKKLEKKIAESSRY